MCKDSTDNEPSTQDILKAFAYGSQINGMFVDYLNMKNPRYQTTIRVANKLAKKSKLIPWNTPFHTRTRKGFEKWSEVWKVSLRNWFENRPKSKHRPNPFYSTKEWKELSLKVREHYGYTCMKCGATKAEGAIIVTDHIKPRSKYPELVLDFDNMQVLCSPCNYEKLDRNEIDYRDTSTPF